MRNLKKILALALALVMSMSLMATANAFTDDDSITDTYETAVTVLSGLKVFQGYDDGSFLPQGAITRAEVAAIIYRIVTGDVADTQVGIYADYNKFDDVASTSWYAGYVNFCANAEYIKGYDARTFGPNDPVTGYQALAMILRALGYDKNNEFTGTNWQVQTAAVGENRGITKNITAGTLNVPATREVVAEILFRAILVDTVNYTPAFGYQLNDTSLGYETFKLEEIEGVVTGNEYADLYDTEPQRAGRTVMNVDGKDYVLNYTTTFDDIGESRIAYVTNEETVLAIGDTGSNVTFETGDEQSINTASKFEDVTGMERTTATEQFVNFDGGDTYEASNMRIEYVVDFTGVTGWDDTKGEALEDANGGKYDATEDTYNKSISRHGTLTATDMRYIEGIFTDSDDKNDNVEYVGEVYVGTQSETDISDTISYDDFLDRYIETNENAVAIDENANGNWLKAIDNDNDGEAEYVLQVIYTVAGVQDISKSGAITLSSEDEDLNDGDALNEITSDNDVVTEDELAEGDIVYYALIDGNAYTYKAEVVTAEIDKVNRNTLTATTVDGDEYVESGVHEHTFWDEIISGVRNLEGDVNYDLYLDRFGYLAAFTESDNNAGFVLLTDGYFETGRTEDTFAAMVWDREAQELVDTDINDGGDLFIDTNGDANDWGNLRAFIPVNCDMNGDDIHTIVAALGEDGSLTPVDEVYRYRVNVAMIDMGTTIPLRAHTDNGDIYATSRYGAYDTKGDSVDVRALASTVYYYVYNTPQGNTVVREYVGYDNIPDLGKDENMIEDVYVVGTRAEDAYSTDYYTAEIVVVELKDGYTEIDSEQVFIYDLPEVSGNVKREEARVIRADGSDATVTIDLSKSEIVYRDYDPALGKFAAPGLYYMWESDVADVYVVRPMTWTEIANSNYVVGTVLRDTATGADDWTSFTAYINNNNENFFVIEPSGETEKRNTGDSSYYTLDYDFDSWTGAYGQARYDYVASLNEGEREDVLAQRVEGGLNEVLVKYDGNNNIVYAISFTEWADKDEGVRDLAYYVWQWNTPAADIPDQTTVTFYGQPVAMDADGKFAATVSYAVAKANMALDPNAIDVESGTIVMGDETTALTTGGNVYDGTILGDDGKYYTFTLTQQAAGTGTTLTSLDSSIATIAGNVITAVDKELSINEFMENFSIPANAKIDWTFENAQGIVAEKDYFQTMENVSKFTAVVTAEDGKTTATYMDGKSATDAETDAITAAKNAAKNELNSFAAPLSEEIAADQLSSVGVYAKTWLEQYKNSNNTGYTVKTVLDAQLANIDSAVDANNAEVAMLNGKIAVRAEVIGAATNNLIRLVGGKDSGDGTSFVGKYWNSSIDAAFDAALNAFNATLTLDDWADGSALTDVIDAYNVAFAAIQPEVQQITSDNAKAAVKTEIGNTVSYAAHGDWTAFVSLIETRIERAAGVSNAVVTNAPPTSYAQTDVITVTYTFDYAGVTYSDSTVVTVVA